MSKPILMPQVGQDIETGFLGEWHVKVGDYVKKGDIIATVESEKAAFDLEAYESGYILQLLFQPGDEVKVLQPVAYVGEKDEIIEPDTTALKRSPEALPPKLPAATVTEQKSKIMASPSARRVAREQAIDLSQITGSGPSGRIIKRDLSPFLSNPAGDEQLSPMKTAEIELPLKKDEDHEIPFTRMRQKIAERLLKSKQTIPHFYLFITVDMTGVLAWRLAYNQTATFKISINDLIIKATAAALRQFPKMNSHIVDQKIILRKDIHIGIAVTVEDGLLVPVIPNTDQQTVQQISQLSRQNIEAAQKGNLSNLHNATFTISNLGMYHIQAVLPIINPPECAILGVGNVEKRLVPLDNNTIGIRDYLTLTLAGDHRAIDGSYAAEFLNQVKQNLENFTF
ncbi:2-oxo acid dehydrogenase subunit E2 [candidate division KSB1 bacterium]|nr:2-oxo acid dehydrogenase subunit E2 [candidate division KSB1 bacterium]